MIFSYLMWKGLFISECTHLSEQCILMMSDWNVLVLRSIGDDLNQPTDLCFGIQGHAEQL